MLDGITVLNSYEVVTKTAFSWDGFWIGILIAALIALIGAFVVCDNSEDFLIMFAVVCIAFGLFLGSLFGKIITPKPIEYTAEYEVTVSDDVSMNDFYNRYDIIEQRGEIYVIREKEHEG